jgi:hypothetical protein
MAETRGSVEAGLYRHYKGNLYWVEGAATHSETEEPLVVYRSVKDPTRLWVRPLAMFAEAVTLPSGEQVPRFALTQG